MDPQAIFLIVMGLACPIGMGLMVWLMNKQVNHQPHDLSSDRRKQIGAADRLSMLYEQRHQLEAEIAELNQIVELEEQRDSLLTNSSPAPEDTPVATAG